jgi:hypothetical protein
LASVSNQSAISPKPSSRAAFDIPGHRVADLLEVLEMAVCMSGLAFRRRTENGRHDRI